MSLLRTVYLGAVICGWMAFGGWFAAEILRQSVSRLLPRPGPNHPDWPPVAPLTDARLGVCEREQPDHRGVLPRRCRDRRGLGLSAGLSNWQLQPQILRMLRGAVAGSSWRGSGGLVSAVLPNLPAGRR